MAVVAGGRNARTHYSPVERFGHATLVECVLDTGRTHQIRVHLAAIGHPLLGDPVYGRRRESEAERIAALGRQALHAVRLEFAHPVNRQRMPFCSALAPDLEAALARLRAAHAK
jgi:23S rRNA pseudouridine1911/1915/1917 synthase